MFFRLSREAERHLGRVAPLVMTVGKVLILPDRNACLDVIDDLRTHSESFFSVCAVNNDEQGNITDLKVTDAVTNMIPSICGFPSVSKDFSTLERRNFAAAGCAEYSR